MPDAAHNSDPRFTFTRDELFPWLVALSLIAKLFFARYLVFGQALGPGAPADALMVFALMGFASAIGGRWGRGLAAIIAVVVSVLTLGTVLYTGYFNQVPGLGVLGSIGQAGSLAEDVAGLVAWQHALFVIDLPFIVYAGFVSAAPRHHPSRRVRSALVATSALLGFFAFSVGAYADASAVDSLRASYTHGITAFQLSSIVERPAPVVRASTSPDAEDSIQSRIDELTRHTEGLRKDGAPEPGAAKGYNLIMIQAEALQDGLIGARVAGQPVMPELEKLVGESIYFPNTYSQCGRGNTSDAEFIANTSLYPGIDQPASLAYARKEVPGLPTVFGEAGYESYTFHTNDARFWNRFQLYPALGFDKVYDKEWFGEEDFTRYGASDRVLFKKTSAELLDEALTGTRFYAHVITLSAHYPFTEVAGRGKLNLPDNVADTPTGRYLQSQSYFDEQLGRFMRDLGSAGLLQNTVVVVYGDHQGLRFGEESPAEIALRREVFGHGYNRADFQNVPLAIRLPEGAGARRYEEVLGQVDIMPTIADLYGLDISGVPHFGRSAFVDTPSVMTRGGDPAIYIDGDAFFIAGITADKDRHYVASSQEKIGAGARPEALESTAKLLELSHAYASSLPERPDATDEVGYIPTAKNRGKGQ